MEHLREEREQIRQLRNNLESRLKVILPDDIGAALMDGVVLCHLANHIRPRSVASIHVPSPAVPKLSMAKCRRNVENFLDACKKLDMSVNIAYSGAYLGGAVVIITLSKELKDMKRRGESYIPGLWH
uniref:Calponin-homology (CH) domain-containing protein n=1 Tax=Pavo cristatus TaxID=9049 RepID=A0A8C9FC23_PAVCR